MTTISRLRRAEFEAAERGAKRLHGKLFSVTIRESPGQHKVSCVVSKQVSGKAVERNELKRRCREIARDSLRDLPLPPRMCIIRAKKTAAQASFTDIKDDIGQLFSRIAYARA